MCLHARKVVCTLERLQFLVTSPGPAHLVFDARLGGYSTVLPRSSDWTRRETQQMKPTTRRCRRRPSRALNRLVGTPDGNASEGARPGGPGTKHPARENARTHQHEQTRRHTSGDGRENRQIARINRSGKWKPPGTGSGGAKPPRIGGAEGGKHLSRAKGPESFDTEGVEQQERSKRNQICTRRYDPRRNGGGCRARPDLIVCIHPSKDPSLPFTTLHTARSLPRLRHISKQNDTDR